MEEDPIEVVSFETYKLGEVLEGIFESSQIVEDSDLFDAALQFRNTFKPDGSMYEVSVTDLFAFVQRIEKDCIDKVCMSLVDKGLVDMSCDENGEFNYQVTELGKAVNDEEEPETPDK